ncbi:MAG TPA: hypothetical protein PLK90_10605 [Clostridiales bacterium]|nr:hypothetical protein [Clostridiales bacterium]HQP70839.1 hypothetical protein [Clostridiales bacterium]
MDNWMQTWGALVFAGVIYVAYQLGKLRGRWEVLSGKFNRKRQQPGRENVEKADYEEIK